MWIEDLTKALYFLNATEYKYTLLIEKIENNCVYFTSGSKCMLNTLVYAYDKYITTGEVMPLR